MVGVGTTGESEWMLWMLFSENHVVEIVKTNDEKLEIWTRFEWEIAVEICNELYRYTGIETRF